MGNKAIQIESDTFWERVEKLEQATSILKAMKLSTNNNLNADLTLEDVGNMCTAVMALIEPTKDLYYNNA